MLETNVRYLLSKWIIPAYVAKTPDRLNSFPFEVVMTVTPGPWSYYLLSRCAMRWGGVKQDNVVEQGNEGGVWLGTLDSKSKYI